jgi:uncharacterized protein YdeI (YjbR/CyaY-like superfamily)
MINQQLAAGSLHKIPADIQAVLLANPQLCEAWNNLTPLARNEWICWVTIVKKTETRSLHIVRLCEDLLKGKRRPCCWPGCSHRRKNIRK